jgi:hypothetical protein
MLVLIAALYIYTDIEGTFDEVNIALSCPAPSKALVNKGHNLIDSLNKPSDKCYLLILSIFSAIKA